MLALVNQVTAPRIETINAEKATKALSAVLSDADQATKLDTFQDDTGMVQAVYVSPSGYAIEVTPTGFGGTIDMMVGISKDGGSVDAITSATITSRAVTSGVNAALECVGKLG